MCPLVAGETDIDQLGRVIATFGSIEDAWPGVTELPDYGKISFAQSTGFPLQELLPDASAGSVNLLGRLLKLDPGTLPSKYDFHKPQHCDTCPANRCMLFEHEPKKNTAWYPSWVRAFPLRRCSDIQGLNPSPRGSVLFGCVPVGLQWIQCQKHCSVLHRLAVWAWLAMKLSHSNIRMRPAAYVLKCNSKSIPICAGARCPAADALLDGWFMADPPPADSRQMQLLVQQTLTGKQHL